jgi:hypothetical protein
MPSFARSSQNALCWPKRTLQERQRDTMRMLDQRRAYLARPVDGLAEKPLFSDKRQEYGTSWQEAWPEDIRYTKRKQRRRWLNCLCLMMALLVATILATLGFVDISLAKKRAFLWSAILDDLQDPISAMPDDVDWSLLRYAVPQAKPVPVELFVMARCPDALKCESVFEHVLSRVGNITQTQLTYIAQFEASEPDGTPKGNPVCKHGPLECAAARQQLCVKHHYPQISTWYRFVRCQNRYPADIGRAWVAEMCASSIGIRYTGQLRRCAEGAQGHELLRASALRAKKLNIKTSWTISIAEQPRCVHDGKWRDCPGGHSVQDFVRDICHAYNGTDVPPACLDYA